MKRPDTNLLLDYIFNRRKENENTYYQLKEIYDRKFYHYGNHFKYHYENRKSLPVKTRLKKSFYNFAISVFVFIFRDRKKKLPTVLSTIYYGADLTFKENYPINISRPPWAYNSWKCNIYNWQLFKKSNRLKKQFESSNFDILISDDFIKEIQEYKKQLKKFIAENNVVALFVPQDIGFFEKMAIDVFKEMHFPTFVFVHSLQFWINKHDFGRTDYLVVWGEASKNDFVQNGMALNKILVSGHPQYHNLKAPQTLRFGFERILVLSVALAGITPSEDYLLTDRSNCIYYLYLIQDCLKKFGVESVYLRPHPSENPEWYMSNLDQNFFHIDTEPLSVSLSEASLVIGPTSTVLFEALLHNVNYLVFNPDNEYGKGLNGYHIPHFYNGKHSKVPVAKTADELESMISAKQMIDPTVLNELVADTFSLDKVYKIISESIQHRSLKYTNNKHASIVL